MALSGFSISGITQAQVDLEAEVDQYFSELVDSNGPGYAIAILKDGESLLSKGYGLANLDYGIPIETKSAFSLASVSKQFTAACIALLILDGKFDLETPASTFLPELSKYRDTIRIKHLVYNTSGIPDYPSQPRKSGRSWITFNYFDVDECIETAMQPDYLLFKPGDQWDYCNVNFMLLTKIVETVSGLPFPEFAQKRLFEPLGMTHTFIHDDITQVVPNRAVPYNLRTTGEVAYYRRQGIAVKAGPGYIQHHRNSPHYGGSGVVSTIEDLALWASNFHSREFGGDAFYELMNRQAAFPHGRNNQAFGLYYADFEGRTKVAWDGGDWGISSELARFPDQGVAIICLSNLGSGRSSTRVADLARMLIRRGIL